MGLQILGDDAAEDALLVRDTGARVDDVQSEFVDEAIVLLENPGLEQPEAFRRARAQAQVHPRFVVLQLTRRVSSRSSDTSIGTRK